MRFVRVLIALVLSVGGLAAAEKTMMTSPPKVGDVAPNFVLQTLEDRRVELTELVREGTVVLVVLRGWPGYQCPLCTRQVHDFVRHAPALREQGARVVMVYPGPGDELRAHAREFLGDKQWPAEFVFVTDPDFTFTQRYGLRWDAKNETAYPSTFVLEKGGRVRFAHVSKSHGDRVKAERVLAEVKAAAAMR